VRWRPDHVTRDLEEVTWPRAGQLVRRSTIGIAQRRFGAIRGVGGCARPAVKRKEWQVEEKREREKTESVSTLTFWGYPCSYEKGVQVEVLWFWPWEFLKVEKKIKWWGGVQMMWQQIRQDLFQEWFVDRRKRGTCNQSFVINLRVGCPWFLTGDAEDNGICKRERVKMGPALVSQCWVVINLSLSRSLEAYRWCDLRSGF
jgi:hypothetical protein